MIDNAMSFPSDLSEIKASTSYLLFKFPDNKKQIKRLSLDEKMNWYAYQFLIDPRMAAIELSTKEFETFWKWQVLVPIKLKRLYYRIKSGQVFKHYEHISKMKARKGGPETI